jgi:hypothetical protein
VTWGIALWSVMTRSGAVGNFNQLYWGSFGTIRF